MPRILDREQAGRTFWLTACLLIAFGVTLRTLGYFSLELWSDESAWARRLMEGEKTYIRPLGYQWVSVKLMQIRNTEPVVRSLSYCGGVLSLPCFLWMARSAGLSRPVSLFGLFVLACHPTAVNMSKEFKPYALELCLHLALLALAFSYARGFRWSHLGLLCAAAVAAPLFAWSIVMLYPALFVSAAVVSYRLADKRRLLATVAGTAATAGALAVIYVVALSGRADGAKNAEYWGAKYDVFVVDATIWHRLRWLLEKTYGVAAFPAQLKIFWGDVSFPPSALLYLQAGLCIVGVAGMLAGRKWLWALLFAGPWCVTIGMNAASWWPYGLFRTNLFLLAYTMPVALVGLQSISTWLTRRRLFGGHRGRLAIPAACAVYALVCLPFDATYFASKHPEALGATQATRRALTAVEEVERTQPLPERKGKPHFLFLDGHACQNYKYYLGFHDETREGFTAYFPDHFRYRCLGYGSARVIRMMKRSTPIGCWIIVERNDLAKEVKEAAAEHCRTGYVEDLPGGGVVMQCRPGGEGESRP